jgi:hypothetical protein
MAITGHLAEFSLPEILQFLEQGHKTGLLTITPLPEPQDPKTPRSHYIWFQHGLIVAAANRSDQRGLTTLISQRGWIGNRATERLMQSSCTLTTPAGLCLKSQGLLQADQLKLLFYVQVMQQVCALFTHEDGWFHFDSLQKTPTAEMTGLSAPAVDVTLAGLRALKNWTVLQDKLPSPESSLVAIVPGKPTLKLKQVEWQVWEFTNGNVPLKEIAQHLRLPLLKVQQIGFRLIVVNLVEEMPVLATPIAEPDSFGAAWDDIPSQPIGDETGASSTADKPLSASFLDNLVGFLKGQ